MKPLRLGQIRTVAARYKGEVTVQPWPDYGPGGRMVRVMLTCQEGRPVYVLFWVDLAAAEHTLGQFSPFREAELLQHIHQLMATKLGDRHEMLAV